MITYKIDELDIERV